MYLQCLIQHPVFSDTKFLFFFLQIEVLVRNHLSNEVFTIHWHGMHQRNTPWMDGASMISQCPIGPGQSFLYRHVLFWFFFYTCTFYLFFFYTGTFYYYFFVFYTGTFYFGFFYRHVLFYFFYTGTFYFVFFIHARFILFFYTCTFYFVFSQRHVLFCLFLYRHLLLIFF